MPDPKLILDYRPPEKPPPKLPPKLPLVPRILLGFLAAFVTLIAAIFITGGFFDMIDNISNGLPVFLVGWGIFIIAYFLWKPVGLRLWPHRNRSTDGRQREN